MISRTNLKPGDIVKCGFDVFLYLSQDNKKTQHLTKDKFYFVIAVNEIDGEVEVDDDIFRNMCYQTRYFEYVVSGFKRGDEKTVGEFLNV